MLDGEPAAYHRDSLLTPERRFAFASGFVGVMR
jgi:hypothetical protein